MAKKRTNQLELGADILTPLTNIYSGSTDNASELRVIGSLLLDEADGLAHYRIVKGGCSNRTIEYFGQLASNSEIRDGQVAELIPQLLDRLAVLGDMARQISQALGGNGHRAGEVKAIMEAIARDGGQRA